MKQSKQQILVIDDEENLRHMLQTMLTRQGYVVDCAADGTAGLALCRESVYDFILCDVRMPGMDGMEFVSSATADAVPAPIIMMSAYGSIETALECMKLGAYDFISKPFKKDEIVMVLKKAEERERLKEENRNLSRVVSGATAFNGIVGRNPGMLEIFSRIMRVAILKTTVLVLGESGTGKELVARAIHDNSGSRASKPFVAINCAAIPYNLLESELFGHVRGAFTDASSDKAGLFEQADGGTLFLDEIGEMPLPLQAKILRVLQGGELRRLGGQSVTRVDVRVISATSRDLALEVSAGRFREDLYFRLNVFIIQIPPLRERIEDIPLMAAQFVKQFSPGIADVRIEPDALRSLMRHSWPGNVRELQNVLERACILSENGRITASVLPDFISEGRGGAVCVVEPGENLSIKSCGASLDRELISKALGKTGGNRTRAAKLLEISHRSLLYKIKEYGLE